MRSYISTLAFIFLTLSLHSQQAWTKTKGKYFGQIGTSFLAYNSYIDNDTKSILPLGRDFVDMSVSLYGEYGVTDYLTVTAQLPFKYSSSTAGQNSNVKDGSISGLSNINLALTGRLFQKGGAVVSAKLRTSLPTGKYDDATGLRTGFDATTIAPSLLFGLGASKFFTALEIGYEARNNGYTNRSMFGFQIGKRFFHEKLIGIFGIEYYQALGESTYDDKKSEFTGLYLSTQTFLSPNIKFGYYVTPNNTFWFSAGFGLYPTDDIPASPGISLSFSHMN